MSRVINSMWERMAPGALPAGPQQGNVDPATNLYSFDTGGTVGPGGMPAPPPVNAPQQSIPQQAPQQDQAMDPAMAEQQLREFMSQNPEAVQHIRAMITELMQSGEITPDELNMAVQLARTALQSPASYPHLRQFAISQGVGTEQDIPEQFDPGLVMAILIAGQAIQEQSAGGGQGGGVMPKQAGLVQGNSKSKDGKVIAQMKEGEYVVDPDTLRYHGEKTFHKLAEQAKYPNGKPSDKSPERK